MTTNIGIYKIESPSGKVYVGQSWRLNERFRHYKKGWCKGQVALYASFVKYGVQAHTFTVLHELPLDVDQAVMDAYEVLYWSQYMSYGTAMLNVREPGKGGRCSAATKRKMSAWQVGKLHSTETRLRIKEARRQQVITDITKSRLSEVLGSAVLFVSSDGSVSEYTSLRAAAKSLGIGRNTITRHIAQGKFWAYKTQTT